jgi:hypothetical protein
MIQHPWVGSVLACVVVACTAATTACATASTHVSGPLVPEGTPKVRPRAGEYDHVNISCGTALYPDPLFVGRVVRRTLGGELVPVLGVTALLETHGTVHATPTATPITIEQDNNGRFTYRLTLWSDTLVYYKGEVAVGWEDVDDVATLTLHASGCEPLRVKYTGPGKENLIEMRCGSEDQANAS